MTQEQTKPEVETKSKPLPVSKMSFADVDAEWASLDAINKQVNESIKAAIAANQPINPNDLKVMQKSVQRRIKLILRRVALFGVTPTSQSTELIDKLMKIKAA